MSQDLASPPASTAPSEPNKVTIEDVIDRMPKVGLNWWAWLGLTLCFFFANYDISVLAITLPAMRDSLGLEVAQLGYPVTWNLVGYAVGAYAFGLLSDRHGRQLGLFLTIAALGIGGLLTAFSWDVWSLTVFRFITGAGMGAVLALCSAYIGEVAPKNKRGAYLSRLYLVGSVGLLVVGFASLPVLTNLPENGWRFLLAFGALVLLVLPLINKRALVESPRWLADQGRGKDAIAVVESMERFAKIESTIADAQLVDEKRDKHEDAVERRSVFRSLFKPPYLGRLLTVLGFWFIFYVAMYGFASYLPLLLEGLGVTTSNALFITVLTRVAPLIAGVIVVALVERIERRTLIIAGTLVFASGIVLIILNLGPIGASAGSLLATFGIAIMATPAYIYTAEVFPTRVRGTAAAICDGVGHLGGAVAPLVILPLLMTAGSVAAGIGMIALLIVAAIIIRLGVRTKDRALSDIAN